MTLSKEDALPFSKSTDPALCPDSSHKQIKFWTIEDTVATSCLILWSFPFVIATCTN